MKTVFKIIHWGAMLALLVLFPTAARASSHMDAPLIVLDPAANTTDVYAFVSTVNGVKYLTTALAVYPHEEPGIGPNKYNFDPNVLYQIHLATGGDLAAGRTTVTYQFRFSTRFKSVDTILQSYLGVIQNVDDASQNLTQTYTVTKIDRRNDPFSERGLVLGTGIVPPNNQGIATPQYNLNSGAGRAKDGVTRESDLDRYTVQTIASLSNGYRAWAGQRDDGFYADINAIFDLLQLRPAGQAQDSQGGFNVHTMVLQIPFDDIGGDMQVVGVYATTSRRRVQFVLSEMINASDFVQVGRQGNPLFCEALVALKDKDLYNQTSPVVDNQLFRKYAENPELAKLLNLLVLNNSVPGIDSGRSDIAGIFIPDMIKVDLSTAPARLAGGGATHPTTPDDPGFSRLSIFGNDVLTSKVQSGFGNGVVPGGWPNGRRFGDDVVDIAVTALISDLRVLPPVVRGPAGDNVDKNDAVYNKVMPYAATPLNGRVHSHP
ncbi:MAG TPA: DUF4331 domain-containing protein [Acidobacteriota bacterium]|jgi:hypothetical protein|nr:DUF4331 domain-containing protein [Acidobacteriota bacterium]